MENISTEEHKENLLEKEAEKLYEKYREEFKNFLKGLETEGRGTKEAFVLLHAHAIDGKELTKEEKKEIEDQMKDLLKTTGLVGIAIMPGGTLIFILAKFLKFNKYIIPSAFLEPNTGDGNKTIPKN
ncbi:MAG TPA: hypothetical protein VK808_02655 [Bacteroidia bacterium]|jgi:hypothetical protein|nr:hypothetical protein [Bacteroidia bacterium]